MRKSFFKILFILSLALELTSCVTTRQINYMQAPKNFVQAYKDTILYKDYQLKAGDKLYIQVYSSDEKTNVLFNGTKNSSQQLITTNSSSGDNLDLYTYTIQPNGSVKLPIIGEVIIKAKTLREAKEAIEDAISPILATSSVDIRMLGRFFNIIGAGKSGRFPFPREKINIFQAIAMSGDFGFYADRSKIKIIRETLTGTEIKVFDARSEDIIHSEYYYLEPNDVIILEPLKQQFFGVSTLWTTISTIVATYSFGVIIYKSFFQ